ncbi:TrkH family potassium uptake protein [Paenibacillus beijingensis]|uniref:Ktr system potassium transporter B n=1 Tax=Paenibacillus beijingensis TaxID=1126833 RepID=A0A0D5NQI4_9BACL|nr:TrkH family potassium uptake protein [Paenibacillus beijingensis]AJY77242.1 Ktr system potassium transporter B [Paenibacillus beijingensis]
MLGVQKYKKWNHLKLSPPQTLAIGFVITIMFGTFLLMLPISTHPEHRLAFMDALFEATSAVCVTGLVVVDTGTTFTVFGQVVLMVLITIGGLGFMTFGILIALLLGKKIGLSERLLIQSATNQFSLSGLVKLVKIILTATFFIEGAGALLLAVAWSNEMGWPKALYYGLFHSISAFNNAGFGLEFDNLSKWVGNPAINLIIASLFILGGIGFTVIMDVTHKKFNFRKWSLHTKLALISTLIINIVATILIFGIESRNPDTLGQLSIGDQILASFFHATTPRTAGFNTLDLTQLKNDSILLTMALMFIGGATGGTAGGIKITTFLLLLLVVWAFITRKDGINVFKRRISNELVFRALSISMIGVIIIFSAVFLLELTEKDISLMNLAFEAVSAFGTVGLSLGATPELSSFGKLIIILLMFVGRLGPLTLAFALTKKQSQANFKYPEEKILIG